MWAALAHPDGSSSLLLMDTAPAPRRLWNWQPRWQLRRLVRRDGCEARLEGTRQMPPTPAEQRGVDFVGEQDTPFLEPARLMARAIPSAHLVTIADATHSPHLENATAWRDAVRDHLLQPENA